MSFRQGSVVAVLVLVPFWASAVTPVEKVVELLTKLEKQVGDEGKVEAVAYDKYACFCKEEVDNKLYAIESSDKKIKLLDAKVGQLDSEITALDGRIGELSKEADKLSTYMKTAKDKRSSEHAAFATDLEDIDGAISACERALVALKESKEALGGKSELEANALAQLKVATAVIAGGAAKSLASASQFERLSGLVAGGQPGEAYDYTYHANDIIGIVEALLQKFRARKAQAEQDEFNAKASFERRQLGFANEKKFAEKEKREKEALAAQKREAKGATEADRAQESKERTADTNFLRVLKDECESKAALWDQRSKTRADELRAIAEATRALKEGAAPNWQANKKLVGLQQSVASQKGHRVHVEEPVATSFLQLRGARRTAGHIAGRISALLLEASKALGSPRLSAAALKVSVSEDHFVKVRDIIRNLLDKLKDEADAERTQKSFCDEAMKKAVAKRDEQQGKAEDLAAQIAAKEAAQAQLQHDVTVLSKEIASNNKALMEANDLRREERAANAKVSSEAGAGKVAIEEAIQVLKTFYEGAALVQFVPANSDREGNKVSDKAPEIFDTEYKGSQEASKGIIGMLEVILKDFDRTKESVLAAERQEQSDFLTFRVSNNEDTTAKASASKGKTSEIASLEDELVDLKDALDTAQKQHQLALGELEKLHSMCVAGEESYEERVAKREKELEALKQAHDILENWQQ